MGPTIADVLTIIGFPIAIVGIGISIFHIIKVRKTSEEAKLAVEDFRKVVTNLDTIEQFSKALNAIQNLKRFIRCKAYAVVPERLQEVRQSLIFIRESGILYSKKQGITFQNAIATFKILEDKYEKLLYNGIKTTDDPRVLSTISTQADSLNVLLIQTRKEMEGTKNG